MIKATLLEHMGSDLTTVNAARVSFKKKSDLECTDMVNGTYQLKKGDQKLVSFLGRHNHISPFGHSFASFHVEAPVFVARQLVKHKFLRWNEVSRRYVKEEPVFYPPNWRWAAEDKKQGSGDLLSQEEHHNLLSDEEYHRVCAAAANTYHNLLKDGISEEQARAVLPVSLMTEWYWSGSLDAFADMCNLRDKDDTQRETRLVAIDVDRELRKLFPHSWAALTDNRG